LRLAELFGWNFGKFQSDMLRCVCAYTICDDILPTHCVVIIYTVEPLTYFPVGCCSSNVYIELYGQCHPFKRRPAKTTNSN
jgi:hypothetical protein